MNIASSMTEDSQYLSREEMMRLHYLWPQKLQNCKITFNLEAIQITTITTKLLQPLYLGVNHILQYNVYGLWLSNSNTSSAFTPNWHPQTYLIIFKYNLKKLNYLQSPQSSTRTALYGLGLQSQHIPSIFSVLLDSLKLNCTGSVSFDSVFSRYCGLFWSLFHFLTSILAWLQHPGLFVPGLDFLGHHSISQFSILHHCYACD